MSADQMLRASKAGGVVFVSAITIAIEVLVVVWSERFILQGFPLNAAMQSALPWLTLGAGLVAVIAIVGASHERIWLVALLFLVITIAGTFFIGQLVLGALEFRRDYTYMTGPTELCVAPKCPSAATG